MSKLADAPTRCPTCGALVDTESWPAVNTYSTSSFMGNIILPYMSGQIRVWMSTTTETRMVHVPAKAVRTVDGYDHAPDAAEWIAVHLGVRPTHVEFYDHGKPYPEGAAP